MALEPNSERRQYERIPCFLEASLHIGHACSQIQLSYGAQVLDLSPRGVCLKVNLPSNDLAEHLLEQNLTSTIEFKSGDNASISVVPIQVKWVTPLTQPSSNHQMALGAYFLQDVEEFKQWKNNLPK